MRTHESPGTSLTCRLCLGRSGVGAEMCIFSKLPGDHAHELESEKQRAQPAMCDLIECKSHGLCPNLSQGPLPRSQSPPTILYTSYTQQSSILETLHEGSDYPQVEAWCG